jgi:hypothetical protein
MRDSIGTLDDYDEWHAIPEDRIAIMRDHMAQVETNLGFLVEA